MSIELNKYKYNKMFVSFLFLLEIELNWAKFKNDICWDFDYIKVLATIK